MERFFLEPDYENFTSNDQLKFTTLNADDERTRNVMKFSLFFYAIPVLAALWFVGGMILRETAFHREGRAIDATVTACQMSDIGKRGIAPEITYSYSAYGNNYEGTDTIITTPDDECDDYPAGLTMPALYLPRFPRQSRLVDAMTPWYASFTLATYILGAVMVASFYAFLVYALSKYRFDQRRYERLLRNGILLDGEVVNGRGSYDGRPTKYYATITYRFKNPKGKTLTRRQKRVRDDMRAPSNRPLKGAPVKVLYADDDAVVML